MPAPHAEIDSARAVGEPGAGLRLVPTGCCICGWAPAEPVAVGEDFAHRTSPDLFLAVRCSGCGLVYLDPAPSPVESDRVGAAAFDARDPSAEGGSGFVGRKVRPRELAAWIGDLPPGARVLEVGLGFGYNLAALERSGVAWQLDATDAAELADGQHPRGAYDVVLIAGALEQLPDPVGALAAAARRLTPAGRIIVLVHNTASASFRLFRGRHWVGYDFPRRRHLLNPAVLQRLAARGGLEITALRMVPYPAVWTASAGRLLHDWGAAAWLLRLARLVQPLGVLVAAALERLAARRAGASLMVATLRPAGGGRGTA